MKKVYTSENRFLVGNTRNILEANGVEVVMRNEHASSAGGEIPVFEAWPELWVVNERDYERALALIENALSDKNATPWQCAACGESNDAAFEFCWKCQAESPQ